MTPHALLVSHKHPHPCDDGKKAVLAGFVAYLVDRYGAAGVTYVVVGRRPAQVEPLPCATVWVDPPSKAAQAWHAVSCLLGLSRLSLQEAATRSAAVARALRSLCLQRRPTLAILDTVRIGQYFETAPTPGLNRVLYMDDLFHLRFGRMLAMAGNDPQATIAPAGTFAPMLPGAARALLQRPGLRNLLYRVEMRKVRRRELEAPGRFDTCLLINSHEAELLAREGRPGRCAAVKPLLFPEPSPLPRRYDGRAEFVLFGSLRHPFYRTSVARLLAEGAESMISAMPGLRLRIVGEGADDALRAQCAQLAPHVELLGYVDDVAPLFTRACGLLVPLISAGGLRLKAVTAMHHGLPVISTGAGVDGIPLVDGVSFLREDLLARYAEPMLRLLDPQFNLAVSRAACRVFEQHYSRERVFREYDALMSVPGAATSAVRSPGASSRSPRPR